MVELESKGSRVSLTLVISTAIYTFILRRACIVLRTYAGDVAHGLAQELVVALLGFAECTRRRREGYVSGISVDGNVAT